MTHKTLEWPLPQTYWT